MLPSLSCENTNLLQYRNKVISTFTIWIFDFEKILSALKIILRSSDQNNDSILILQVKKSKILFVLVYAKLTQQGYMLILSSD